MPATGSGGVDTPPHTTAAAHKGIGLPEQTLSSDTPGSIAMTHQPLQPLHYRFHPPPFTGKRSRNDIPVAIIEISQDELMRNVRIRFKRPECFLACVSGMNESHIMCMCLGTIKGNRLRFAAINCKWIIYPSLMGSCTRKGSLMRLLPTTLLSVTNVDDAANVAAEQRVSEQRHSICCATKFGLHIPAIYPAYYHTTLTA
ncbi:hypothetical protein CTI12_AA037590 [Artemisia annua]|uniref:Uncharacterized protein n=1 Tax=Artemisia annua TaxID=35608 RepID=A0A2U1QF11_ARTAN|nr:hypothetical protein CTI12_AA037590 [Artemisia annua]